MPRGKAANRTSDQARVREGLRLPGDYTFAPSQFFNVPFSGQTEKS
jgi:hypothetical protein